MFKTHYRYQDTKIPVRLYERAMELTRAEGELDLESRRALQADRVAMEVRSRPAPARHTQWIERLLLAEEHLHRTGKFPSRHSTDPLERGLYSWMVRQRHATNLSTYQKARLRVSPIGITNIHEARWMSNAARVQEFISNTHRYPRVTDYDAIEHSLARWWNRQADALHRCALPPKQAKIVRTLIQQLWHIRRHADPAA